MDTGVGVCVYVETTQLRGASPIARRRQSPTNPRA